MKFEDMINTITLGDTYKLIKDIPNNSIDLIVIDPPYDFMKKHKSNNYTGAGAFGKLGRNYHCELENLLLVKFGDLWALMMKILKKQLIFQQAIHNFINRLEIVL